MRDEREEPVATLIAPAEYAYHLNEVAELTTRNIVFLKRKFVSTAGHELVKHPLDACTEVKHFDERPVRTIVSGALLVALIAAVLFLLVTTWDRLEPGTRIPIGLVGLAGLYGVRRVFGARRHRLVFRLKDGTTLSWKSGPGDYETWRSSVERIVELANARGILSRSRLTRA